VVDRDPLVRGVESALSSLTTDRADRQAHAALV
jgi:hypothetical protein